MDCSGEHMKKGLAGGSQAQRLGILIQVGGDLNQAMTLSSGMASCQAIVAAICKAIALEVCPVRTVQTLMVMV
jgi:hypothetical protein